MSSRWPAPACSMKLGIRWEFFPRITRSLCRSFSMRCTFQGTSR